MKILIYCATAEDKALYPKYAAEDMELQFEEKDLTADTVNEVQGFDAVVLLTRCIVDEKMADTMKKYGVKYVLTRSAGYDHMDLEALKENGLKAANVSLYSPNAISEHVCMVALMMIRNMRRQLHMIEQGDFTLNGIRGRELRKMTVGIVGAGRIGFETLKIFHAFTDHILIYDMYQREDVKQYAQYATLEQLYRESDLIIYHCPLTRENQHLLNDKTIKQMKDGVLLINPARGGLWDYGAVYEGLRSGKIGAAAFDVYETEKEYLRKKVPADQVPDELLQKLIREERVIYTAHSAFYTDVAIENMVEVTVNNLKEYKETGNCKNELIKR